MDPEDLERMETSIARQEQIGGEIENIVKNFKKDGKDRKTLDYFIKRLEKLNNLLTEFRNNNDWLQECETQFKTSEYFTNNYDVIIINLAEQYMDTFKKSIKELSAPPVIKSTDVATGRINNNSDFNVNKSPQVTTATTNNGNEKDLCINLIRRQNAMISSLKRLILANVPEDATAPSLKAKERLWEQIQDLHFNIFEKTENPSALGYNMETYMELEVKIMQNLASATQSNDRSSNTRTPVQHVTNVPLPKITIPRFDGDYAKWPTFSDLFQKVIHEQPISSVQKMWYLKTNLTGEAERLVRHLALTDYNYDTAWSILKDRFNNKRVLTASIIQQIVEYQNITSDATSIKAFHDTIQENLAALKNLKINTDNWDPLLLHTLMKKLDRHTHILYESSISEPTELQTIGNFLTFLQQRFQALESMGNKEKPKAEKQNFPKTKNMVTSSVATSSTCKCCNTKEHPLYFCNEFKKLAPPERLNWVQSQRLCVNCFKTDHKTKFCKSRSSCSTCQKRHHSLLHLDTSKKPTVATSAIEASTSKSLPVTTPSSTPTRTEDPDLPSIVAAASGNPSIPIREKQHYVLLATAKVRIMANNGQCCEVRAVLDAGSQINLVTQRLINKLSLTTTRSQLSIEGVGQRTGSSNARVNVNLESRIGEFSTRFEAFVIPQIISPQPSQNLKVKGWNIPEDIDLADPEFFKTNKIDVLIGAEFYHILLRPEQVPIGIGRPVLQNTALGWIVIGKTEIETTNTATCAIFSTEEEKLSEILERFWAVDDLNHEQKALTISETACETHFANTVSRNSHGRFIVRLPFFENPSTLGESKYLAERRFESLERRFERTPLLQKEYAKFLEEYEALNHMEKISEQSIPAINYFIPHHCVLKPDSTTTKLRVVFDASAKTSTGVSLNDILQKGPTVQSELFSILLRFRSHRFVFTADIEKMYRQILVHEEDTAQQLIVWRKSRAENFQYYRLKTVTYGTTSAPYLATKCLQHLATLNMVNYPLGATVIRDDFYVDDCLSGSDDITSSKEIQRQITKILDSAGFKLRKWCANHPQLLAGIPEEDMEINLDLENASIKTLGLIWLPKSDELCGRAHIPDVNKITKRSVSSDLARIFDPLGIFAPVIVKAKIFMQQLWELKMSWDQELPIPLAQQWFHFRNELLTLNSLKTHRHIFNAQEPINKQIHTFVDASEQAYGAAVYVRATYKDKTISTRLLCAKSKVAPMKKLTIPRLELCAAELGAELTNRVRQDLKYANVPTFFWSDSEIVLSWIQSSSSTLHTFVANRISRIHQTTTYDQWHHVSSKDNPADILSRGISPEKLASCSIWFHGPFFLYGNKQWWLQPASKISEIPNDIERRTKSVVAITHQMNHLETLIQNIEHRNSFRVLQNIVGYLRRPFIQPKPKFKALFPSELRSALLIIIKAVQSSEFKEELKDLKKFKAVGNFSSLATLAPFIDELGILRVGGRLESSSLTHDAKHPMLLPYNDPICKLIFQMKHEENMHCGPQALLAAMRQNFWPLKGKITARSIVHNCIACSKAKPKLFGQLMGNLPSTRVLQSRPFLNSGVDYCGPFWIHYKIRGKKPTKAYLAIFCCFATKAVHLELVSDLTTNGFIGALTRFINRRGRCQNIYSDNGTNFVGTKNQFNKVKKADNGTTSEVTKDQIDELKGAIFAEEAQESIIRHSSEKGITFNFIPAKAPHFGGLWEAAVKSAKHHLLRSISSESLTYEELETVMTCVEAILNSRPLTPLSSDPNDLTALTPGHFLIGEPLTAIPSLETAQKSVNLQTQWKNISYIKHEFWKRWSKEYLHELQQRNKWKKEAPNVHENMMVIVKDDNLPVMRWPLGRILKTYKGNDGLVRVAEVKTSHGIFKRPIHLLAPLPTSSASETTSSLSTNNQISSALPVPTNNDLVPSSLPISIPLNRLRKADTASTGAIPKKMSRIQPNLSLVILTLLLLPLVLCSQINQHEFPNKPGIYFEGIGTVHRVVGEWKIITFFDLNPIRKELELFKNGTLTLQHLCPRLVQQNMCLELVKKFDGIDIELQTEAKMTRRRMTRGALDIVGNVANKLFGVLDSDYAEKVSETINQLYLNDDIFSKLIQNQTSVIDSTVNIVKRETEAVSIKINSLQQEVNNITKEVIDLTNHVQILEIYTSIATQLSIMAAELERIEDAIFDALTDARHGRISPLLISPQRLQEEIMKIKGHLPRSLHLPFNKDDAIYLYSLMSSQSGISSHHVIFVVTLPLTNNEEFDLFHLTPIPATVNYTMLSIHPDTSFLAVTPHRDQYFALTQEELQACIPVKQTSSQLLCSDKPPKFHQGAQAFSCELNMLKNKTSENCIFNEITSEVIWNALYHANQWIFTSIHATQITAVCNGSTKLLELKGSNLITLEDDCILKHHSATIQTHQTYTNTIYESHIAFGDLGTINKTEARLIFNGSPIDLSNELQQLKQLHQAMNKNKIIELPTKILNNNIHHYITSYSALLLIIGTILWIIWKLKQMKRLGTMNSEAKPTPAPRFTIDPEIASL